jgi:phospholipid/cholesterol/gamma-HCH transport system ATP-binding protein
MPETKSQPAPAPPAPPKISNPVISLRGVHKRFGKLKVLQGVDLEFEAGKTTVILGPSGSGKSVMLKHIVGLLKPDSGEVHFEKQRIDNLDEKELAKVRHNFGFLFQQGALFDSMTVEQNVGFPLLEHTEDDDAKRRKRVEEVLGLVGLAGSGAKLPSELSGGQKKRIGLARAIALSPKVILYDEPTTGLDPIRADTINELVLKLQRELSITSIVVTHDMRSAEKIADRIVMLYDGKIVWDGTPDEIVKSDVPLIRGFVEGRSDGQLPGLDAKLD